MDNKKLLKDAVLTMVHDLSPFLWQISGEFGVRWYGLSYMVGFVLSYFLISWICRRQKVGLNPDMVGDFVTYAAFGILIGGRLGYCLFYDPQLFIQFKSSFPFWGVLAVNEGGMASHGGMIGLVVGSWIFATKNKIAPVYLYDLATLCGPIGIFFGRIANYINGELVGRPCPEDFPLAVKFPQDILQWPQTEVSRLTELTNVVEKVSELDKNLYLEMVDKFRIDPSARDYVYNSLYQIIHAIQSGNTAAKEAIAPLLTPRYPSQLFAAFGEGLFLFVVLFFLWKSPRKTGVVGSVFVILYAIVRIVGEQFRTPDAHIGLQLFNLTRGQWLSIGMLFIGIVLFFIFSRRDGLPVPGWGRGQHVRIHRR